MNKHDHMSYTFLVDRLKNAWRELYNRPIPTNDAVKRTHWEYNLSVVLECIVRLETLTKEISDGNGQLRLRGMHDEESTSPDAKSRK